MGLFHHSTVLIETYFELYCCSDPGLENFFFYLDSGFLLCPAAGLVYLGVFLRKKKKTSSSGLAREVCVQISGAVQQV